MNRFTAMIDKIKDFINLLEKKRVLSVGRIGTKVVWNLFLIFLVFMLIGGFFVGGVGAGYFASLVKDEPIRSYETMKKSIYNYEETSSVYFKDNILLGKLRSDLDRKEVPLDEISDYVEQAIIATEDQYFDQHPGVVPKALFRAVLQEVTGSAVRTGGSTLTQQLIKNQILTNEVSFERKAKEILIALRLEKFFEKDEILTAYLNVVPFGRNSTGRNIAGVQAAAKGIFGVDAKDLTLVQAAYIAGLPQNPYSYTPFTNGGEVKDKESLQPGIDRMHIVLKRMLDAEKIKKAQYDEAIAYDITKDFIEPQESTFEKYPALTMEVERRAIDVIAKQLAAQEDHKFEELKAEEQEQLRTLAERQLRQNGYNIHTTIDKKVFDALQKVKNEFKYLPDQWSREYEKEYPLELGVMLIENKTGAITGFVGGRDYHQQSLNHATQSARDGGSTIKPLLDYGPALELGIVQPGSIIPDLPLSVDYQFAEPTGPNNWNNKYHGLLTAREALEQSWNVPATRTFVKMDSKKATSFLYKMGFEDDVDINNGYASLSIGTANVTVEENTNAFATFANGGKFVDAYMIEKIVDNDGNTIFEHKTEPVEVFSPQTAYLTLDMMRDVLRSGTGTTGVRNLKFTSDWAGKTGTAQEDKDAWYVATNPNVTLGLWIGFDIEMPINRSPSLGSASSFSQKLWAALANAAYDVRPELMDPSANFKAPGGLVTRSYCTLSGLLPSDLCKEFGFVGTDLFNAKYAPKKVDDSLQKIRMVVTGDGRFRALENTPAEFTDEGVILKKEFLDSLETTKKGIDLLKRIYKDKKIMFEQDVLQENGKAPAAVQGLSAAKNKLTWKAHSEKDVVGYRIYRAPNGTQDFIKVGSVKANVTSLGISAGNFTYRVTAVDIAGQESAPSNTVMVGEVIITEPPIKPGDPDEPPKPPKPPGKKD
jgi:penicillin-binding protein 1B